MTDETNGLTKPDLNKPVFKIFPEATKDIKDGICPTCGTEITGFRNSASEKEYNISGMCQKCQDKIFGED